MTRWARRSTVLWRRSGSAIVILSPEEPHPFLVTGTATLLWELLARPIGETELAKAISDICGADPDGIRRETEPVLAELERRGAVGAVS